MMLGLGEDDAVDQHAGHLDAARIQRSFGGDPFDLRDDDAARVARRDRQREVLERERLALGGDIAVGISRGPANQRNLDRERLEEQVLAAVDFEHADDVLGRPRVHPSAPVARIDIGSQSDRRQGAGLAGADVAIQVREDALGQVVSLDLVRDGQLFDPRYEPEVAADHALEEPCVTETVEPLFLHVALPAGEHQREVARRPGGEEALLQCDEELVRRAVAAVTGRCDHVSVVNHGDGVFGLDDFLQPHARSQCSARLRSAFPVGLPLAGGQATAALYRRTNGAPPAFRAAGIRLEEASLRATKAWVGIPCCWSRGISVSD